jgi:hypothetical protein
MIYFNNEFVTILPLPNLKLEVINFKKYLLRKNITNYRNISVQDMDIDFKPIGESRSVVFESFEIDEHDLYHQNPTVHYTLDRYLDPSKNYFRINLL